jgi:P27 family predicted phage terminase small subunit
VPGPPPEHPHLRLLKGNPGKRRVLVPPEPARSDACPSPPEYLTGYAREAWLELAPELHKLNLLTILDIGPFSAYCCAYAHWQQAEEALQRSGELTIKTAEGHPRVNPLVRIASSEDSLKGNVSPQHGLRRNRRLFRRIFLAASSLERVFSRRRQTRQKGT